jgi:ABC-type lipoprotein release transport system permease subunit
MNPLSPFTYYRRHKGQALLLLALIGSLTLSVYMTVSLTDAGYENLRYFSHYLTRMSRLSTSEIPLTLGGIPISAGGTLDSGIAPQIRARPDVAAVLPENGLYVGVPTTGAVIPVPVLGVTEADLPVVMKACDLRLKAGRSIRPRAGEIVLSEELARALGLMIGDHVSYEINADYYASIATELTLVGILESVPSTESIPSRVEGLGTSPSDTGPEVWTGFVSYEYLDSHELYQPRSTNWLIIPRPGSRMAVNDFAASLIAESAGSSSVHLETFESVTELWGQMQRFTNTVYGFGDGLVAVAAALVVGMVHRIAIMRRLPELGLLHAAGYRKRRLVRRLVLEIAAIACVGWATGLLCAHAFSILLSSTISAAQGWSTNLADPTPFLYTLPIPLVVVAWINVSVNRTLNRLDPVAVIERGKLSMERNRPKQTVKQATSRPLSSLTFFARHRRRSVLLLATIGAMVLGVALPGFSAIASVDSTLSLFLSYTSHTAIVSPGYTYRAIAPDVVAQIRAHPAVAHVIPVKALGMVVNIPTAGELLSIPVYAVREQDLPVLLDVYGLHLGEGELVQPRSDGIVLTSALARNRNLGVGDAIGHPVHERDGMPTELTVVGLLEPTSLALVERAGYDVPPMPRWVGFASYEYVDDHERYAGTPTHMLVVPVRGRESEMEMELEETFASPRVKIETLGSSYRFWRGIRRSALLSFGIIESILAVVTVGALAILNYIFVTQRRDEFGVLHAVGHSRAGLITRTLRESIGIAGAAWLIGAACCLGLVLTVQATVYTPLGTSLDWTNPTPWLFTLPIPLAVVVASAGTIAWTLSKLDPVAVIERR